MLRRALGQCGSRFGSSGVAVLGTDGLVKNPWSRPEPPPITESVRKKGARISLYPGETGTEPWAQMVGEHARVESSLLRAVANANCTVVALPRSSASELDADQLATEMHRPGPI